MRAASSSNALRKPTFKAVLSDEEAVLELDPSDQLDLRTARFAAGTRKVAREMRRDLNAHVRLAFPNSRGHFGRAIA